MFKIASSKARLACILAIISVAGSTLALQPGFAMEVKIEQVNPTIRTTNDCGTVDPGKVGDAVKGTLKDKGDAQARQKCDRKVESKVKGGVKGPAQPPKPTVGNAQPSGNPHK
jgi:hypothetical protein